MSFDAGRGLGFSWGRCQPRWTEVKPMPESLDGGVMVATIPIDVCLLYVFFTRGEGRYKVRTRWPRRDRPATRGAILIAASR